jgi:hypothetical protein
MHCPCTNILGFTLQQLSCFQATASIKYVASCHSVGQGRVTRLPSRVVEQEKERRSTGICSACNRFLLCGYTPRHFPDARIVCTDTGGSEACAMRCRRVPLQEGACKCWRQRSRAPLRRPRNGPAGLPFCHPSMTCACRTQPPLSCMRLDFLMNEVLMPADRHERALHGTFHFTTFQLSWRLPPADMCGDRKRILHCMQHVRHCILHLETSL